MRGELTPSCSACPSVLLPAGAAAAADGHRQAVPEEAHRDPGAGAAGAEPGHAGGYRLPARLSPTPNFGADPGGFPQDSDNPDLRDRGYIYWRLLSTDPVAAKEVVLAEKPLISEETDLIEPTLLDELICYIGTLASVYHKPPSAFVEGSRGVVHKSLPPRTGS